MKIRPKRLQKGDAVGIIALGNPVPLEKLRPQLTLFEEMGLQYKLGQTIGRNGGYLAGSDEERLGDLHQMMENPEVKAIFCASVGYGAARIADRIDYPLLSEHPKIFWGCSDATYLHIAFHRYADVATFHGPALSEELDGRSKKMFYQLFAPYEIYYDETLSPLESISPGAARGEIIGGNLRRITDTLGTKFEIDVHGKILLLEEVDLAIEEMDNMLNRLRLAGKLKEASGFAIGRMGNGEEEVNALLREYLLPYKKPALAGFYIGHSLPNLGIPLGVEAILDADEKVLRLLPGVE